MSGQGPWASGGYPPPPPGGTWPGQPGQPAQPWQPPRQPPPAYRTPTPVSVIFGRIIAFVGIAAALICSVVWVLVGMASMAAGPLCLECYKGWLPPVAVGVFGPLVPLLAWAIVLPLQWRRPLLLLWSLLGWPILGVANIVALGGFAALFSQ